jgi:hypothetical protein
MYFRFFTPMTQKSPLICCRWPKPGWSAWLQAVLYCKQRRGVSILERWVDVVIHFLTISAHVDIISCSPPPSPSIWPMRRTGSCVYIHRSSLVKNLVKPKTTTGAFRSELCLVYDCRYLPILYVSVLKLGGGRWGFSPI